MAKTNLNLSPYFDDFDATKNFYKVLFKPGYPVQARELTTLQSILQDQISAIGKNLFKDGSVVVPGDISYDSNYYAVKINPIHLGLDVEFYYQELIGKKLLGDVSQVTCVVQNVLSRNDSIENVTTLYVKYLNSNSSFNNSGFIDGETLTLLDTIKYGNTTITSGNTIASLIESNSTSIGSAVSISPGIYYLRDLFVTVDKDTIILDQYSNTPSYRVGLSISEEFISSYDDNSLYDNAKGFTNYSAPGADRFKLKVKLAKQLLNDYDDTNFIEIIRITNGVVKKIKDTTDYSLIKEYLSKRTYEQSGNFSLSPFFVDVADSLNNLVDQKGLFTANEKTEQNNTPSEDIFCVKISSGKAYVNGNDIEKSSTTILDSRKTRSLNTSLQSPVLFEMGNLVVLNNVSGCPAIGVGNTYDVKFFNKRKSSNIIGTGTTIGKARIYSFSLSDSTYQNKSSKWNLYTYDIQTYTRLTLNANISNQVTVSSHVKGLSSGASGYVAENPNSGNTLYVYQTSGSFVKNEQIIINSNKDLTRTISDIKVYGPQDIKSVYQDSTNLSLSGLSTNFSADAFLQKIVTPTFNPSDTITINPSLSGISTVTSSSGLSFVGIKTESIIRYQVSGLSTETYNRVVSVSEDGLRMHVEAVPSVDNVCLGSLPSGSSVTATFSLGESIIKNKEKSNLYVNLTNKNVSTVDLSSSKITLVKQVSQKSTSALGQLSLGVSGDFSISNGYFEPFSPSRYSIFYSDGSVETLTSEKVQITNNGSDITFYGLKPSQSANVAVICTITKNLIRSKSKIHKRSQQLLIDKTSLEISNGISGLTTSKHYGTRVEDIEICLNVPDVSKVLCVYESPNSSSPILDKLVFPSESVTNAIIGERIYGSASGSAAQIVDIQSSEISFVYLNSNKFQINDIISFEESKILVSLLNIYKGSYIDKTNDFVLDKGQKDQYYDYSKIVRNIGTNSPAKKLLVIYNSFEVSESDSGDLYTANSYNTNNFKSDVPILKDSVRASDVLDFRPRVSKFTSLTSSPFDFSSRVFSTSQSSQIVVAPNESTVVSYSYYVPRIDKLILNKNGNFQLINGFASLNPQEPASIDDAMDIAKIEIPAYIYRIEDIKISLIENKRYTMKDITKLEDRIEKLENFASLSLLELDVKSLQIIDTQGLGLAKYKCGFFADSFIDSSRIDYTNKDAKVSINSDVGEMSTDVSIHSLKTQILPSQSINLETVDYSSNLDLVDLNTKKSGDLISLNYSEIEWGDLSQPFATDSENINPNGLSDYNGHLKLRPSTDLWVKTLNPYKGSIVRSQSGWNNSYLTNLFLNSEYSNKMRSRNIEFLASNLFPLTNYTSSFDGSSYINIIPKLLKISMTTGIFNIGETVEGYEGNVKVFSARVCSPNHKYGNYNNPSEIYTLNPYQQSEILSDYSQSTTVLNIDTYSLSDSADGRFYGYAREGLILVGKTSGAQCVVGSQSLISDNFGDLIGSFFVNNPFLQPEPTSTFNVGDKTFKLESSYTQLNRSVCQSTLYLTENANFSNNSIIRRPILTNSPLSSKSYLSQTFKVDNTGGFLTSIDLFFKDKDASEKVTVEIREVDLGGSPTNKLLQDFARVQLLPSQINTSSDGTIATNFKLPSPLYLERNKQYCITVYSPSSSSYSIWTAVSNNATVTTQNYPNSQQVIYSNQFIGGNLYKPQNGTSPVPSLLQDLKFKLYKAQFVSSGTVFFTNPILSNTSSEEFYDKNNETLVNNPITGFPKKFIVGITTSYLNNFYTFGKKIEFSGGNYGFIDKSGGKISGITTTNVGAGYSNGTYSNVPLYTIKGFGPNVFNTTANLTFTNNKLSSTVIVEGGSGYSPGDLLGIATGYNSTGSGALISVSTINGTDTLLLTNVPGGDIPLGNTLIHYDQSNTKVSLAGTTVIRTPIIYSDLYSGNTFKVEHYNHGHHSNNNYITISGVFPDTSPEPLVSNITSSSNQISIANTSVFYTYDNSPVVGVNTGYVLINNEIISYSSVNNGYLQISARGVNGSTVRNHSANDMVYKYECNNVGLNRINTTHKKPNSSYLNSLETPDSYYLQFSKEFYPNSNFIEEKTFGGSNCKATQNYQYNSIIPKFNTLTPGGTSITSSIRTVSGTSASGSESSFNDQGLSPILLNSKNDFDSPRLVCSRINEINNVQSTPRLKSLLISLTLRTTDTNVSPIVDLVEGSTVALIRNKLNTPILNYVTDDRSNLLLNDPHSSIYISKQINLLKPASSLKVITNCFKSSSSDFRVLYKLIRPDSSGIEQTYEFFPGYSNLKDLNGDGIGDTIIDTSLNDGTPDFFVGSTAGGEYSEYEFTADNLGQFVGFVIKIVMSGSNEAKPLKFKDIRAIALA